MEALDQEDEVRNQDIAKLRQAWVSEATCPEILPYEEELVDNLLGMAKEQEEVLNSLERTTSDVFAATLYEMEIERVKFSLSKYLRTRLIKIEKYVWKLSIKDEKLRESLSFEELDFVDNYKEAVSKHFKSSVLDNLPAHFQTFPDVKGVDVASYHPSSDTYLFVKGTETVNEDGEHIELEDGENQHDIEIKQDMVFVARYPQVEKYLKGEAGEEPLLKFI